MNPTRLISAGECGRPRWKAERLTVRIITSRPRGKSPHLNSTFFILPSVTNHQKWGFFKCIFLTSKEFLKKYSLIPMSFRLGHLRRLPNQLMWGGFQVTEMGHSEYFINAASSREPFPFPALNPVPRGRR